MMLSGPATDVSYSPDGKYLVSSDGNRKGTQILIKTLIECSTYFAAFQHSITFFDYSFFSDFIQS